MRIIIMVLIFILLFTAMALAIEKDKVLHFGAGAATYIIAKQYSDNPMIFVIAGGLIKELYDSQSNNHKAEVEDLLAVIAGGLLFKTFKF